MTASRPTVIFSFDCEGRWGVADHLTEDLRSRIRNANLVTAYRDIVQALDDNGLNATFAFCAAVLMSADQAREQRERLKTRIFNGQNFADAFLADMDKNTDGWLCPELVDIVRDTKQSHEIGCHGYSHVPWEATGVEEQVLDEELSFASDVFASLGEKPTTFVFPRNKVHAIHLLKKHGYIGYRRDDDPSRRGGTSKARKVVNKLSDDLFRFSDPKTRWSVDEPTQLVEIPAGYFIPWRVGYRRAMPLSASQSGFNRTFDQVCRTAGVFHIWLHPWNLIGAPETKRLFFHCVETIGAAVAAGKVDVATQHDFCQQIDG